MYTATLSILKFRQGDHRIIPPRINGLPYQQIHPGNINRLIFVIVAASPTSPTHPFGTAVASVECDPADLPI